LKNHQKICEFLIKLLTKSFFSFIFIFNYQILSAASLNDFNALPDLGQPINKAKALNFDINEYGGSLVYKKNILNNKLSLNPEYLLNSGFNLGASLSYKLSDKLALGFVSNGMSGKNEFLINAGIKLSDNQRLIFTVGQLRQKFNLAMLSGIPDKYITQYSHAFSYKYLLPSLLDSSLKFNGYISDSQSQKFNFLSNTAETAELSNFLHENGMVVGSKMMGFRSQLLIHPSPYSQIKMAISNERIEYKIPMDNHCLTQYVSNIKWSQSLNSSLYLKAGFQQDDNQKRYKLGFEHLISNRQQKLGLNLVSVHNMSAMPDDKQIQISYSYKFGEKYSNPAIDWSTNTKNLKWTTSLEDKVVSRSSFIPSSVPTY
jgi:hypothetical protein